MSRIHYIPQTTRGPRSALQIYAQLSEQERAIIERELSPETRQELYKLATVIVDTLHDAGNTGIGEVGALEIAGALIKVRALDERTEFTRNGRHK